MREWFIEFVNPHEGAATVYSEKVDGLNKDAVHVVEFTAYETVKKELDEIKKQCYANPIQSVRDLIKINADIFGKEYPISAEDQKFLSSVTKRTLT